MSARRILRSPSAQRAFLAALLVAGLAFAAWLPAKNLVLPPPLVQKVEAQRGQPLSREQRELFLKTAGKLREALVPAQAEFTRTVAALFRIPEVDIRNLQAATGSRETGLNASFTVQLEAHIKRPISAGELQKMRSADNAMRAEMRQIELRFAGDLAQIAGLSIERMQRVMPTAGL